MHRLQTVYRVLSCLLFGGIVAVAVLLCALRLFSFSPYMVLTGSMQPQYPVGSLVYVRKTPKESLAVGDSITFFMADGVTVVTHQIVAMDAEDGFYYTKGIANDEMDASAVAYESIIGKVYFCIPYLGYVAALLARKQVRIAICFACAAAWALGRGAAYLRKRLYQKAKK